MDKKWLKILENYDTHCQKIKKKTTIDLSETAKEKKDRMDILESEYILWFEEYLSHYAKSKCAKYHKKLAKLIIGNKKSKTLAEIFRSGAKSVHVGLGIPLYLYFVKKDLNFFVQFGENAPKAKQLISSIQAELEYNQKLINDYGLRMGKGNWADGDFLTTDGVRFKSLGWEQSARGLREGADRPDYICIDDVDSKKHVNNDTMMSDAVEKILEEIMGCFDASDGSTERLVYANNNFHKNSITNRLKIEFTKNIKIDKRDGDKSDYTVFTVTAVVDLINFVSNWPEKTTSAYWKKKHDKNPSSFKREYMHIHVSAGRIFKPDLMQYKEMLKLHLYDALIMIGDLSYKDKGDFKGLYLIGKIRKEYHIIHCFLRQCSRNLAAEWLYDLYEDRKLLRYNITYTFDGLFAQGDFENDFDDEGETRGYFIPIVANGKSYGNKYDHIESILGRFIRKWVFWNIKEKEHLDQIETLDQFDKFEKGSGAHDDGPDAVAVGFKELDLMTFIEKFDPRITERETYQDQSY
ncbi:hypothetical protein [Pedobacter sp. WC2423]|uniref:hypothetical protein n=1 Tax=Pedobacter sp. WC2423 TaxID=3234142 RepID=UPI0034676C95